MNVKELTDTECLNAFIELLETRITFDFEYVVDEATGNLTHKVMIVNCGEMETVSDPVPLPTLLRPATPTEAGVLLN